MTRQVRNEGKKNGGRVRKELAENEAGINE